MRSTSLVSDPQPVAGVTLSWGESLRWDDRSERLFFVDCAARTLHWLDGGEPPLHSLQLPGLPTGVVLTNQDDVIVVALDDGLFVVDIERERIDLLVSYPEGLGGRANDANADFHGNLVTGTLNLAPGPGSYWWFSSSDGWRCLADGIGNANGPVVLEDGGRHSLVFADTHAATLYAFDYDGATGTAIDRRVFAATTELGGVPDGACADGDGGVWSCILGAGLIARFTREGTERVIPCGVEQPSDVTFGGPNLERLFFTSIALPVLVPEVTSPHAGAVMSLDGTGARGRPEGRFRL